MIAIAVLASLAAGVLTPVAGLELDRRRMLTAAEHVPWRGVGRVNVVTYASESMCTGTLIGEDLVLTAAHCVINPYTGAAYRPADVHFVAGWRLGQKVAHSIAVAIAPHPRYQLDNPVLTERVGTDLALIRLADPIPRETAPYFTVDAAPHHGTPLTLISYRQDRPHALTRQKGCEILEESGPVLALGCDVTFGASGSPVFVGEGDATRLVAVISAMGVNTREPIAYAIAVDASLPEVLPALK